MGQSQEIHPLGWWPESHGKNPQKNSTSRVQNQAPVASVNLLLSMQWACSEKQPHHAKKQQQETSAKWNIRLNMIKSIPTHHTWKQEGRRRRKKQKHTRSKIAIRRNRTSHGKTSSYAENKPAGPAGFICVPSPKMIKMILSPRKGHQKWIDQVQNETFEG